MRQMLNLVEAHLTLGRTESERDEFNRKINAEPDKPPPMEDPEARRMRKARENAEAMKALGGMMGRVQPA